MKKAVKLFGYLLSILSVVFVVRALLRLGFDFSGVASWSVFLPMLLIGIAVKTGTVFVSSLIWTGWLRFFSGRQVNKTEAFRVYTRANIGKYLPGNVMQYVGRNVFAGRMGISQKKIALSSLIEVLNLVGVSVLLALMLSPSGFFGAVSDLYARIGEAYLMPMLIGTACLAAAVLAVLLFFSGKIRLLLKGYSFSKFIRQLLLGALGSSTVLLCLAGVFAVFYMMLGAEPDVSLVPRILAGYIISWTLGFVVPGSPGGIGVREFCLTMLLSPVMGESLVLTVSVIHRLVTIIGDFAAWLICLLWNRRSAS